MCKYGITPDTAVIVYCLPGQIGANHKLTVMLEFIGVKHVYLLNGNMDTWLDAGYDYESGLTLPDFDNTSFGLPIPQHPELIVDMQEVKDIMREGRDDQVIDMRTWEAYIGEDTEYDYVPLAGRIPGTMWVHDKYHYFNPDDTIGNVDEVVKHWFDNGVNIGKRMAFFCGSGAW